MIGLMLTGCGAAADRPVASENSPGGQNVVQNYDTDAEAQGANSQNGDAQSPESQNGEAQDSNSQNGESQASDSQITDGQITESQNTDSQGAGAQSAEALNSNTQNAEAQNSNTQNGEAGANSQDVFVQNNGQSSEAAGGNQALSREASDGTSSVKNKPLSRKESFMEILYKYKEAQDGGYTMDQVTDMELDTELVQYGWPEAVVNDNVKYLFYDLDLDGQDELIITYYGDIIDIYGYDGEKARLAHANPYRGVTSLFPNGMIRLDFGISADYYNSTWYQYDSGLGDFFEVFGEMHNPDDGTTYHTFCYYNIDDESHKQLEQAYRESDNYPVWIGEWSDELTREQYEKIAPKAEPIKLPEGELISKIELPNGYESQLTAATTLGPGETLESRLLSKAGVTKDKLQFYRQDDFDGDGQQEAFALIGGKSDMDWTVPIVEGDVWFVSPRSCKKLHDNEGMGFGGEYRTMKLGNLTYVMFDEQYATGVRTDVWYVSDGRANDAWFTEKGYVIPLENDNEHFCIEDSSYDCMYDPEVNGMLGHTWKYYYFYYEPKYGTVQEYGGTEIDRATVTEVCGKDIVSELITSTDQIDTIYYRDNGQIIINFSRKEDGCIYYYHYIYNLPRECLVDDTAMETGKEPLQGIVLKALCPDMASYPEKPKGSDWYGH